jgi:glutaminyl-peptide cyclotransferase
MKKPIFFLLLASLVACKTDKTEEKAGSHTQAERPAVEVPQFNADSAYAAVVKQVNFGPRTPGSKAHAQTASWLVEAFSAHADTVLVQTANVKAHDGKSFGLKNIIASFNPAAKKRIVLAAHWDTRPRADMDDERTNEAIDGANDGASGVGVLLEVARQLAATPVNLGIDIVLFDLEDYGIGEVQDSYCLGSQYWSQNPHVPGYKAQYGILLDMVGAKNAVFYQEGFSTYYAPQVVRKVWDAAYTTGMGAWFSNQASTPITDDHYYVNKLSGIPMIDIIQHDPQTSTGFGSYWHTHDDTIDIIDKATLRAVGQTLLHVLYNE